MALTASPTPPPSCLASTVPAPGRAIARRLFCTLGYKRQKRLYRSGPQQGDRPFAPRVEETKVRLRRRGLTLSLHPLFLGLMGTNTKRHHGPASSSVLGVSPQKQKALTVHPPLFSVLGTRGHNHKALATLRLRLQRISRFLIATGYLSRYRDSHLNLSMLLPTQQGKK